MTTGQLVSILFTFFIVNMPWLTWLAFNGNLEFWPFYYTPTRIDFMMPYIAWAFVNGVLTLAWIGMFAMGNK